MADRHTKAQRSWNMSRIRKFGNDSTEMRLLKLFRFHGIKGWRRHLMLPGRPDFAFPAARVAVFIDGCFWHCCPKCNWVPATNIEYWNAKFSRNKSRDREANRSLRKAGWTVVRVWEHALANTPNGVIARIRKAFDSAHHRQSRMLVVRAVIALIDD